tara:strand:+ start:941 stop:1297 length:357 start_codon:yes stop_codon:yes gene_type:complete
MEIDAKLIITVGGMLISIVSAATIVKQKLASVIEQLNDIKSDYESRLRDLDKRTDRQENAIDLNAQKTHVLSSIMSPERLEKNNRELEKILVMAHTNGDRITKLEKMHNGKHPPAESV